jgi:hypothetical protein
MAGSLRTDAREIERCTSDLGGAQNVRRDRNGTESADVWKGE